MTRRQHNIDKALDALKVLLVKMEDLEPSLEKCVSQSDYRIKMGVWEQNIRSLQGLQSSLEFELGDVE